MQDSDNHLPPGALPADAALFLDFDGTLVELANRPDAVIVDGALSALLQRLREQRAGRVAIISGRSIAQLDDFLGAALDGITLVGSHGAEIRTVGGTIMRPERPASLIEAERAFTDRFGDTPGAVIEVKSLGVAIHYRLAPEIGDAAEAMVADHADRHGLAVQKGKMMSEVRVAGHDKGTAITALMQLPQFAGYNPVFAGDDLTDEAGFLVCSDAGGGGILIGPPRDTAARWRIADVAGFRNWLEEAA